MENLQVKQTVSINAFKTLLSTLNSNVAKEVAEDFVTATNAVARTEKAIHMAKEEEQRGVPVSDLPFINGEYTLWLQLNQMSEIAKKQAV